MSYSSSSVDISSLTSQQSQLVSASDSTATKSKVNSFTKTFFYALLLFNAFVIGFCFAFAPLPLTHEIILILGIDITLFGGYFGLDNLNSRKSETLSPVDTATSASSSASSSSSKNPIKMCIKCAKKTAVIGHDFCSKTCGIEFSKYWPTSDNLNALRG